MLWNLLMRKDHNLDPKLAKFPQTFEDRKIIYPHLTTRLIALLLDFIIVIFLITPFYSIFDRLMPLNEHQQFIEQKISQYRHQYKNDLAGALKAYSQDQEIKRLTQENKSIIYSKLLSNLLTVAIVFIYLVLCNKFFQNSFGKKLLGLYVLDNKTYKKVSLKIAILRNLCYILTLLTLGVGFFIAIFNLRRITLHDYIAGTVIVRLGKRQ
jgi:uncharacterized RDD family membrane protein YckC